MNISDLGVLPPIGPNDAEKLLVSDESGKGQWKSPEELKEMSLEAMIADVENYWVRYEEGGYVQLDGRYNREQLMRIADKLPK